MELISSDTNIWIDFVTINQLALPFLLDFTYLMNEDAIEDELLQPKDLKDNLISLGLKKTELTIEEFRLSEEYGSKYKRLSVYDRIALAIAKKRNIKILLGDMALRIAAEKENVKCIGTLGILDLLLAYELIPIEKYKECLELLEKNNGSKIRLPKDKIANRYNKTFREELIKQIRETICSH